jgi:hypothetical protein
MQPGAPVTIPLAGLGTLTGLRESADCAAHNPDILQHNGLEKVILFRCVTAPREACAVPLGLFIWRFRNKLGQDQRISSSTWQVDEMSTKIRCEAWSAEQWAWQI